MKCVVTRDWIRLSSETLKEAESLNRFIWGPKPARFLFLNGTHHSTDKTDVGVSIRKVVVV